LLDRAQFARAKQIAETDLKAAESRLQAEMVKRTNITLNAGERVQDAWNTRGMDWRRKLLRVLGLRVTVLTKSYAGSMKRKDYFHGFQFKPEDVRIEFDCLNIQ
jgi:site-specific DNA recombinase